MKTIGAPVREGPRLISRKSSSASMTLSPPAPLKVRGLSMVVETFIIGTFWK